MFFSGVLLGMLGVLLLMLGTLALKRLGNGWKKTVVRPNVPRLQFFHNLFSGVLLGMLGVLLVMLGTLALETLGKRLGKTQRAPTTVFSLVFFRRCVAGDAGGCCFCLLCVCVAVTGLLGRVAAFREVGFSH